MEQKQDSGEVPTTSERQSNLADWSARLPQDLQARSQWVVWRYGMPRQSGKREKRPYTPTTGRLADTTNAVTWDTYDETNAAHAQGSYEGIGFVFADTDPYCGVD